ncbi:MAG: ATP-NAD kinase family protein [Natrialbaceae archaeon]|nr:ATP-NAD kinase family protein [Natrialbaceae archaeon]
MDAIGFVVNPVAGMGGRVGLKGTDGVLAEARERGATPRAPGRARTCLAVLASLEPDLTVYTAAGEMGATPAREAGFDPIVVYEPPTDRDVAIETVTDPTAAVANTTAEDTRTAVQAMLKHDIDLVLFVGGDGTAVDVARALEASDQEVPLLGAPAGVKVYSSVFGVTPGETGEIAATFDRIEAREINDIDEAAYREGEVRTRLEAVVDTPVAPTLQAGKQVGGGSVEALAHGIAQEMDPQVTYLLGPGGTVGAIEDVLDIDGSPLGVDVVRDGQLLERDCSAGELLAHDNPVIVVSPIGGQGFIFGRGNQQFSPAVIDTAQDIQVIAAPEKLDHLDVLRVDTDDEACNERLRGWHHVRTGRFTTRVMRV